VVRIPVLRTYVLYYYYTVLPSEDQPSEVCSGREEGGGEKKTGDMNESRNE